MHQPSDQCRPARCQHESRGQGRHWSGVRRSTAAPATPARRLLRSESRRSSSPRHSSWSLSFSAEIFSAAWRAPMSSNMERVAAMPDASLYVNRDGRRADDCVDSHGGGNLTKIPRSGGHSQKKNSGTEDLRQNQRKKNHFFPSLSRKPFLESFWLPPPDLGILIKFPPP